MKTIATFATIFVSVYIAALINVSFFGTQV